MSTAKTLRKTRCTAISALLLVGIVMLPLILWSQTPTDIEREFIAFNSTDLSGAYQVTGVNEEPAAYTATLQLAKWKTFKTQRGNVLQTFKMNYEFETKKFNGIAVFDGHRVYFAAGEGNEDNFSLSILSKLVLSPQQLSELANFWDMKRKGYTTGKYPKWEDKSPWFGYLDMEDDVFGYKFPMTGKFTEFSSHGHGFPPVADTGRYRIIYLKENGEHDDKKYWIATDDEHDALGIFPRGENLVLSFLRFDSWKNGLVEDYWGSGMLVASRNPGDSIFVAITGGPEFTHYGWMDIADNKFAGIWSWRGSEVRGTEEWIPSEEVAKKNPHIFQVTGNGETQEGK